MTSHISRQKTGLPKPVIYAGKVKKKHQLLELFSKQMRNYLKIGMNYYYLDPQKQMNLIKSNLFEIRSFSWLV